MPLCTLTCVHDDHAYLAAALRSVQDLPRLVFVSRTDWAGGSGDWEESVRIAEGCGAEVEVGDWASELSHRDHAMRKALQKGFTHAVLLDSDEVVEAPLLDHLKTVAESGLADRAYVEWDTYWKDAEHVVRPRERFTPCMMVDLRVARNVRMREFEGGRLLFLNASYGIVHHLSYAGGDARIWKKITTWSHRDEVVPGWWERSWKGWDAEPLLRDLHPTHPESYRFVERIPVPEILRSVGLGAAERGFQEPSVRPCSVVIPAHGGQDDLDACLASLARCGGLVEEIVVVDDGSPVPLTVPEGVRIVRTEENLGFARACNAGYAATKGETVLFLNSDTVVPRAGLARLLEALERSGSVAAAGPYSNNAGHGQGIPATYTDLSRLDLFAESFAERAEEDRDVDMLVGFCLAVKRRALEEVGLFDPRFGRGTFEDNDLSYRMRRAGYRLVLAGRAFVHHEGSKTMRSLSVDVEALMRENHKRYVAKWREDLDSGFASGLSGLGGPRIAFDPDRKPETRRERIRDLARRADLSLCMIVRNEERTLRECLESAKPFVRETLVLDTGSTDRTVEIARECGAVVREMAWPDSFAAARTESMREAKGRWVLWLDADDTLPLACGETIVRAVASAPEDTVGFVVPVRFLEEQGHGTAVDHVKAFRNYPGLEWEGRIHEQILGPLRRRAEEEGVPGGGRLARLDAFVLHSGYDVSPEGQARKRARDEKLLRLDLEDRPDHPFVLFNLGMTAHYTDAHEEAVVWLRRCLAASGEGESHVRKAVALLVGSLKRLDRTEEARRELEEGLVRLGGTLGDDALLRTLSTPGGRGQGEAGLDASAIVKETEPDGDPEILFLLAGLAAGRGEHALAVRLYRASLAADTAGVFTSVDPGIRGWKALHNLALSHVALGEWPLARSAWRAAMDNEGRYEAAGALFATALEQNDVNTARETLFWVRERQGEGGMWPGMVGEVCRAAGLDPVPQWEEALRRDGGNDEARKRLALALLDAGREQEAVPHLDLLQRRGHAEGAHLLAQLARNNGEKARAEGWLARAQDLS